MFERWRSLKSKENDTLLLDLVYGDIYSEFIFLYLRVARILILTTPFLNFIALLV